jgi:hypothetical protein
VWQDQTHHKEGREGGVDKASAATALVTHSTSAAFLSTSCTFLLTSPSMATTYDLVVDAIKVTLLIAEGALKKLEHGCTTLKAT